MNRPFDDQEQVRIRLESAAVGAILERFDEGTWTQVSSAMALIEIEANPDPKRRDRVRLLLPEADRLGMLTPAQFTRAEALRGLGFKAADALHIAGAEAARADVLLTCDDRMLRTARRHAGQLRVSIRNPMDWLNEVEDEADA